MVRHVAINENAVIRAEKHILKLKEERGERYTLGTIFAKAINNLIDNYESNKG